jgi:hypothetical protein
MILFLKIFEKVAFSGVKEQIFAVDNTVLKLILASKLTDSGGDPTKKKGERTAFKITINLGVTFFLDKYYNIIR